MSRLYFYKGEERRYADTPDQVEALTRAGWKVFPASCAGEVMIAEGAFGGAGLPPRRTEVVQEL